MVDQDVKFRIDVFDAEKLWIIPENYDFQVHGYMDALPEKQWRSIQDTKGWVAPATEATIAYIERGYRENHDYFVSENARILIKFDKLTHMVDVAKARRRWEYLFEGRPSDFIVPAACSKEILPSGEVIERYLAPFDHQRVAIEAAYGAEYFAWLMEMGTGKTLCFILELARYATIMDQDEMIRAVVVCPKSLQENWRREIVKFMPDVYDVEIGILRGDMKSIEVLVELISAPAKIKVAIVSYDSVATMLRQLKAFKPTIINFDESHFVKNSESKRWKAAYELCKEIPMRRISTGTPVANTILDIWSQFQLLRPGALGYGTFSGFRRAYCDIVQTAGGFDKIGGYKNVEQLKENMARMSFIVRKEQCLDLPDKMYDILSLEMPESVREIYIKFANEFYVMLDSTTDISTEFIIVQMLKLSQICCGFVTARKAIPEKMFANNGEITIEEEHFEKELVLIPEGDYKLQQLIEDIEEVTTSGKVIVWSRFRYSNQQIVKACLERGIIAASFDGGTKDSERQIIIDRFNGDDQFRVFVGNPGSGGVGLTLLGTKNYPCHTTFFYSNDFSYGKRLQAEDRCHRIGQTNKVLYKDYVARGSIEEYIAKKLQSKKDLSDAVKNVGEIKELLLRQKEQFGG